MTPRRRALSALAHPHLFAGALFVGAALASCRATAPAATQGARSIGVGKADPPPGARSLGAIDVVNGHGCGLYGTKGSYEGAVAELRGETEARGGDYVQITKVIEPHVEGGCYDVRFVIRGVVFRVNPSPVEALVAPASPEACVPACSAGYLCESGICRAKCDPPCEATQACGQDRTCRPRLVQAPPE